MCRRWRTDRALRGLALALIAAAGCETPEEAATGPVYASELVSFEPGPGAGFGQDELPDVVLGAPAPVATGAGSLDVVALGDGGVIVVAFGDHDVVDGDGADLIVFENAFHVGGDPTTPFAELAEVAVSNDGEQWHAFPCDTAGAGDGQYPGCAGWQVVHDFDPEAVETLDPETVGGDAFDLADLGVARARYVRITDLTGGGFTPSVGFDLDAVGLVHAAPRGP